MNNPRTERLLALGTTVSGMACRQSFLQRVTTGVHGAAAPASASAGSFVTEEDLFLSSLPVINNVTAHVCRRHHLNADEAADFRSEVRLHFIKDDYRVLRSFQGRSNLRTYLTVVIQRLFLDYRNHLWGKWRPSVEARRLGPTAILMERLVTRDGWPFEQAIELLRVNTGLTLDATLLAFGDRLAARQPARQIVPEAEADGVPSATPSPEDCLLCGEDESRAQRIWSALARARESCGPEERLILKMRFDDGMSVADIARTLQRSQKRLYGELDALLDRLCRMLEAEGISRDDLTRGPWLKK